MLRGACDLTLWPPALRAALLAALLAVAPAAAAAASATIAVAANFNAPLRALAAEFERASGHALILAVGSTGQLYAQIRHGAPYDVILAADAERPAQAEADGLVVAGSRFTYAIGRLALYAAESGLTLGPETLGLEFRALAIANPRTAPYGAAAEALLHALGRWDALAAAGRIAQAQNIGGAFAAVKSGAAEFGIVALSYLVGPAATTGGSYWTPPQALYPPLRQDAALLIHGADNPAAIALLAYLRTEPARARIREYGYDVE